MCVISWKMSTFAPQKTKIEYIIKKIRLWQKLLTSVN